VCESVEEMPGHTPIGYSFPVTVQRSRSSPERGGLRVLPGGSQPEKRERTDAELIDAFERGEGRACEELYDRLIGVVEGTLWRVLGRRDQHHDDLVQAAFEQIVLTLSHRKFARACSLASWASSVTTHIAFNAIRARTRERKVVDRGRDTDSEATDVAEYRDLEREVGAREDLARVRIHLAEMDWGRATTLFLHDVLGHELAEIAVLTGVSVAAAQSRLVRGRKELQDRLLKGSPDRSWRSEP
jgi:RNA polymerase sigma-70 factor, ECF subfamily